MLSPTAAASQARRADAVLAALKAVTAARLPVEVDAAAFTAGSDVACSVAERAAGVGRRAA